MRKLIVLTAMLLLAGLSASYARGGTVMASGLMAPANPSVPPSLTPDMRVVGSAPLPSHQQPMSAGPASPLLQPDPEDAAIDRKIGNICRGC
jgi:hypothetical protein